MEEKRLFQRILFSHEATLQVDDERWTTQILDLSLHGFLCTKPSSANFSQSTTLTLILKLDDSHSITMIAELVHRKDSGLGFQCSHIDIDSITELKRLVQLNLGNEELLHRELALLAR